MFRGDAFGDLDELTDPAVVRWRDLSDPSDLKAEVDRLQLWVDWMIERYLLDHKMVPTCWSQHGSLIEELSALRTLWEGCFQDEASPSEPITFHRELDLALRRLREWTSRLGCSRTAHRPERHTDSDSQGQRGDADSQRLE